MEYFSKLQFLKIFSGLLIALFLVGCDEQKSNEKASRSPGDSSDVILSLYDFESANSLSEFTSEGATATLVNSESGGKALQLNFGVDAYYAKIKVSPEQEWDWSGEEEINLAMDIRNLSGESVQLYLGISDTSGSTSNYSTNLAVGESNTYYIPLSGRYMTAQGGFKYGGGPSPWTSGEEMFVLRNGDRVVDVSKIKGLEFFQRGNLTSKQIVLDNLRLRRNPDYDLSYIEGIVDEFGQNAKVDYPIKIHSEKELMRVAEQELKALENSGPMADRSRFGGWKDGPRLEATGYFRTEKVNGKWWMVDPEGYLFFSHGLANVRMANLTTTTGIDFEDPSVRYVDPEDVTPEDSMGIVSVSDEVRSTRYIASEVRRNMFNWLPDYDHQLADHYSYRRDVFKGPLKSGETFSFYRANLERKYGEESPESYLRKWEAVTLDRMQDWGFTSFGNWVDPAFYPNQKVPYFANGWIIGDFKTLSSPVEYWSKMPDPFDPEFVRRTRKTINVIADEIQSSPWCVGIFIDNEKSWGLREGTVEERYGLILDAINRPVEDSPAKGAFTEYLKQKYGDVAEINAQWNIDMPSWEAFEQGISLTEYSSAAIQDFSYLLELLSEEYFKVVHNTLEEILPNHMYMGARMASWGMPDETIKASIKYSDVLSFNVYEEGIQPNQWSFLYDIDLPSIIGEFHVGAISDTGLYHPGLVMAHDQSDRAQMYLNYMESVLAHDTMVGAHWFQYVDSPISGRTYDGENYNVGFVSTTDIPYPEMVSAAKKFNSALYKKRYGPLL